MVVDRTASATPALPQRRRPRGPRQRGRRTGPRPLKPRRTPVATTRQPLDRSPRGRRPAEQQRSAEHAHGDGEDRDDRVDEVLGPALPVSPATWVSPISPSAPGTSSQKPGRNAACLGARGAAGTPSWPPASSPGRPRRRSAMRRTARCRGPGPPGRIEHDEEGRERSDRCGVRHDHAEGGRGRQPGGPRSELVARALQHQGGRDTDRLDARDDAKGEQRELHDPGDQAARAGDHLAGASSNTAVVNAAPGGTRPTMRPWRSARARSGPGRPRGPERRHHEGGEDGQDDLQRRL